MLKGEARKSIIRPTVLSIAVSLAVMLLAAVAGVIV